jgi:tetratricopeptide (TPR) repeat protein
VILVHGLGGVGKTTLARGFVKWLHQTNGLGLGCLWLTFRDIRTAESVLNQMGTAMFGPDFIILPNDQKVPVLAQAMREHRFMLVWDNFESVWGNEPAGIDPLMPPEDRKLLLDFLRALGGGQTKVIMTSRSDEPWLPAELRRRIELGGLVGEERWEFCTVIMQNLGLKVDREDSGLVDLMKLLNGHPLLMRAVLPRLERQSAQSVAEAIRGNMAKLDSTTDATLRFVEEGLPAELRPLLVPLGLHERYVDADYLEEMAKQADPGIVRTTIDRFLNALATAGLIREVVQTVYELHPALAGFLRAKVLQGTDDDIIQRWVRAFVDVMGRLANTLAPLELHEQRGPFTVHEANFHVALGHAECLGMNIHFAALTQSLAAHTLNTRNFDGAERLFIRLTKHHAAGGNQEGEAAAYHQLGRIAEERRDFDVAEQWYLKSLAISEKLGNEHGVAITYHQLGMIAQERRDFVEAKKWYLKSLAITEKQGNEHGAAGTYHQLGRIAQERRDFEVAEQWYLKSLAIEEKQGNEHGAAITYHQLGRIAEERRDFDVAEQWYLKSLAISEKLGIEHSAANTYHQLGSIAEERRDFDVAEKWYLKSLAITEKQGNEHGAASTYGQLGIVAGLCGQFEQSGQWFIRCVQTFLKCNDEHGAARNSQNFAILCRRAPAEQAAALRAMWEQSGLPPLPEMDEPDSLK